MSNLIMRKSSLLPLHQEDHPSIDKNIGSPRTKKFYWSFFKIAAISCVLITCSIGSIFLSWYPGLIEDALINQELIPVPLAQGLASMHNAEQGRTHMSQSSVSIYAIGRNVYPSRLQRVLQQLSVLERDFAFAQTVLVDGNSTNGATDIMQKWVNESPSFRYLLTTSVPEYEPLEPPTPFSGKAMPREGRIAYARNLALKFLRNQQPNQPAKLKATDYMIVLDLDIVGWNPIGVYDGFGRHDDWDVLCANGIILHGLFRDTYALRTDSIFTNHHYAGKDYAEYNLTKEDAVHYRQIVQESKAEAMRLLNTKHYASIPGFSPQPIQVNSCFGGLALYKYDISIAQDQCQYQHRYPSVQDRYMLDCEHVLFHQCLAEQTQKNKQDKKEGLTADASTKNIRIFSSPHMKLWYGHSSYQEIKWQSLWNTFYNKINIFKWVTVF